MTAAGTAVDGRNALNDAPSLPPLTGPPPVITPMSHRQARPLLRPDDQNHGKLARVQRGAGTVQQEFLLYGGACDADSGGAGRGQNLQRDRNPSRKCHLPAPPLRAAVPLLKRRDGARASG
jgi:hypothetical protein